ncbi:MAG: FKBP-type peptidyl-prolyl cis-trans isomerase [Clostridia bacterium]|nr:FKBP-type peptidyl-prolyl cis-trans isomerase [Clostridia bacterium]
MLKRSSAVILAMLFILTVFAGCSGKKDPLKDLSSLENTPIEVIPSTTDYDIPLSDDLKYDINFADYITLPDITTLELSYHTMSVDDTSVNNQMYLLQLQKADRTEITDRGAAEGDVVTVNYRSVYYGTDQQISNQSDVEISLGKHIAIPALEDAIIGMTVGQTKTADIVYPEDYAGNTVLANSKATFTIELKKIETAKLPELNEETIKSFGFEGVTTYTQLREYIINWMEQENSLYKQDALYNALVKGAELIAMPQTEYSFYLKRFEDNCNAAAQSMGTDLEAYITTNYGTNEAYKTEQEKYAQDNVKKDLVIHALKEKYNVEVTKEEYNRALNVTFNSEAASLGITDIEDFHNKMGESIYKMELTYQVIGAAVADAPDKK